MDRYGLVSAVNKECANHVLCRNISFSVFHKFVYVYHHKLMLAGLKKWNNVTFFYLFYFT